MRRKRWVVSLYENVETPAYSGDRTHLFLACSLNCARLYRSEVEAQKVLRKMRKRRPGFVGNVTPVTVDKKQWVRLIQN